MSAGTPANNAPDVSCAEMLDCTVRGCQAAKASAEALFQGMKAGDEQAFEAVKKYEEELDRLDYQINDGVTTLITRSLPEKQARELLACLKFILELERIGDLLLNVTHRFESARQRLDRRDADDLVTMASIVAGMLSAVTDAFTKRDVAQALTVLSDDAELDRLRNLMFVRHVENPEHQPVRESYHLLFMSQMLERAGDHAKNLAEEICHLVTGRSVRHLLREYDKPTEQMFVERWRRTFNAKP
jgi:phosphate transport system protein